MELRERIAAVRPSSVAEPERDAFAEVKDRIHAALIAELGPRLVDADVDAHELRERVRADVRARLAEERGIALADRDRLVEEITDDTLGYGPLERLLADDSITEVMVNG